MILLILIKRKDVKYMKKFPKTFNDDINKKINEWYSDCRLQNNDKIISYMMLEENIYLIHFKTYLILPTLFDEPNAEDYESEEYRLAYVLDNKTIVSWAQVNRLEDGSIVYFDDFITFEPFRKQGYGTKLLRYAIKHGLKRIDCLESNKNALRLYYKLGFKRIETYAIFTDTMVQLALEDE